MRHPVSALLLTLVASVVSAETPSLELRWELKEDVFGGPSDEGASRAVFTLTNRGAKPLASRGWTIYFNGMQGARPGSVKGDASIENLAGDLHRLVPSPGFPGLAPGATAQFEYLTSLIASVSFAPTGPYVVFDEALDKGYPLVYRAVPFERPSQSGRDPRVVTPEAQYALNEATGDVPAEALPPVFPTPQSLEKREGRVLLEAPPSVSAGPELQAEANLAKEYLRPYFAGPARPAPPTLSLAIGRVVGQESPEAYTLVIDPKAGITIVGNSAAGVFYGLQSLRGLLPVAASAKELTLPALKIVDGPRFAYRGLHLDVARNFQPRATILRTLDLMARYKLNVFHFHLTEDEAWRLEMPSLPELTAVGARRGHTLDSSRFLPPAFGSGPDVDKPFGSGFYSAAEYTDILKYAAARHIEVIPEIESPGHARAAIKAMEARFRKLSAAGDTEGAKRFLLSDPEDRSVYTSAQNWHDNVMNPALPSTYAFIEAVVKDLVALHRNAGVPLRNLHMGGDEVPSGVWEKSPVAQAYIKEHRLGGVDDLWFVFYGRVEQILKAEGIPLSGWEEIGVRKTRIEGKGVNIPNPDFAGRGWRTYVWNNVPGRGAEDLAYRLANGGYKVVLAPVSNLYFDMASNKNPEEPGLNWGGYVDVDKPFQFIPYDYFRNVRQDRDGNPLDRAVFVGKDRLTDYGRSNIVGLEGCLWSETLGGEKRVDYLLIPKILGLAERAWAPDPVWAREADDAKSSSLYRDAWSEFVGVLGKRELPRLERAYPGIAYRIPTPGLKVVEGRVHCNLQIPGFVLRYTSDGSEPTAKSLEVRGPVLAKGRVRVAAFDSTGRKGHTAEVRVP